MAEKDGSLCDQAKVLLRLPYELRKKLKIIAACENSSMNEKALSYIERGVAKDSNNVDDLILKKD